MRVLTEPKIVLASHNKGKLHEIQALLAPFSRPQAIHMLLFGAAENYNRYGISRIIQHMVVIFH